MEAKAKEKDNSLTIYCPTHLLTFLFLAYINMNIIFSYQIDHSGNSVNLTLSLFFNDSWFMPCQID